VILSDGDVVFQPRKIQRSGMWRAVEGRVLIYVHKELMLDEVKRTFPARHYVMVDDKPRILGALKAAWGDDVTTIFPRQGHYALDTDRGREVSAARISPSTTSAIWHARILPGGSLQQEPSMTTTQQLHDLGQSLWIDNISRET
jgi:hypothetical protein